MMHYLTFAGKSSHDFGIRISGEGTYNAPKRKYTEETIAGRNGTVLLDDGSFENIDITYPAFVFTNMPERVRDFRNYMGALAGYQRLEDTYAPETFRMAQYSGGIDVKTSGYMNRMGEFDITFNCKPQRFLKSGEREITFTENGAIYNPTEFEAQPHIRVYGTGDGTVGIGSYLITIEDIDGYIDIDCELMDAYKGTLNCNSQVSFNADDFKIRAGQSGVTFSGDITSVIIKPRFYII